VLKPLCHAQTHSLEPVTGLESGFNSLSLQQQAASRLIIDAGSAGHAGLLGLKLMTLLFALTRSFGAKPSEFSIFMFSTFMKLKSFNVLQI
jgi:hypothetical protein